MENKKNIYELTNQFKNYLPFAALFVLTAGLLFYFKENKQNVNEFIETGKDNLVSFYTQNLKPLLFKTDITNEDVFNFAVNQNLPIDKKENKVLQIGYDEQSGNEFFEIKPAEIKDNTQNYKKFANYLKLDDKRQAELDSILNSYKDELYTSVFYNDKNTIAVNSKVSFLRDAILADVMAFAQNASIGSTGDIPAADKYNTADIRNAISKIREAKGNDSNNFVVFTPDSIFKTVFEIDTKKLNKEMSAFNWDMKKFRDELKDIKFEVKVNQNIEKDINEKELKKSEIKPDSNYSKTFVSKDFMAKGIKDMADITKLRSNIEKLTANIQRIKVEINTANSGKINIKMKNIITPDSALALTFDLNLNGLDSLIKSSISKFDKKDMKGWEEFGLKMDSLANSFEFNFNDSTMKFDKKKFKEEIQKAKKELQKK